VDRLYAELSAHTKVCEIDFLTEISDTASAALASWRPRRPAVVL